MNYTNQLLENSKNIKRSSFKDNVSGAGDVDIQLTVKYSKGL